MPVGDKHSRSDTLRQGSHQLVQPVGVSTCDQHAASSAQHADDCVVRQLGERKSADQRNLNVGGER